MVKGKIIDEALKPVSRVWIANHDTAVLAQTDTSGRFSVAIPDSTTSLIIMSVGSEWKFINLAPGCHYLEMILLNSGNYDFMSARKVDRERKKYFDRLPKLHRSAYEKGVFDTPQPCYEDKFVRYRERLKEIQRTRS